VSNTWLDPCVASTPPAFSPPPCSASVFERRMRLPVSTGEWGGGWLQGGETCSLNLCAAPQVTDFAGCSNFIVVALVTFLLAQSFFLRQVSISPGSHLFPQTSPNSSEHYTGSQD